MATEKRSLVRRIAFEKNKTSHRPTPVWDKIKETEEAGEPEETTLIHMYIMSLIHPHSYESFNSGLICRYFLITNSHRRRPVCRDCVYDAVSTDTLIEFVIPGTSEEYPDLFKTFLHLRVKVKRSTIDSTTWLCGGLVNNYLKYLITQVDVTLIKTLITASENNYAKRAYLEATLDCGEEAKTSHIISAFFYPDIQNFLEKD